MDITLRDILSISGVSNQTLYNYFPNGRDDIAIVLFDRYQTSMLEGFRHHLSQVVSEHGSNNAYTIQQISACLAHAVLGVPKDALKVQSALHDYLKAHNLLLLATHTVELEAALEEALDHRLDADYAKAKLPRLAKLAVRIVREVGTHALADPGLVTEELESNARMLVRTLLLTGDGSPERQSGGHLLRPSTPAPAGITAAPISPAKKKSILERILKRKGRR